jgi:hypothetical protein
MMDQSEFDVLVAMAKTLHEVKGLLEEVLQVLNAIERGQ